MTKDVLSEYPLINRNDSVLVIIDMQEKLVPAVIEKKLIVENIIRLVKFSRIIGLPVVITEQQKLGDTVPVIRQELMEPQPIDKMHFNCFGEDAFSEGIRKLGRKTLILAGIEAHICVTQTALHAVSDFSVHVVSDAISSRSSRNYEVAIMRMQQCGVTITSTEMVIYELLEKAGTDDFKEVLKLVK